MLVCQFFKLRFFDIKITPQTSSEKDEYRGATLIRY